MRNVQKIDTALRQLQERFPFLRFKAKQTITSTKAKGWGVRFEREQTETVFEPFDEVNNERE